MLSMLLILSPILVNMSRAIGDSVGSFDTLDAPIVSIATGDRIDLSGTLPSSDQSHS